MNDNTEYSPVTYSSKFGGLWTDLSNAHDVITGKRSLDFITEWEETALRTWVDKGYVIIPKAVADSLIDETKRDVGLIYENKLGKCLVETFESGQMEIKPVAPRHRSAPHKLLDVYPVSEAARKLIFSEKILKFLSLIFERPPVAFQGLYFEKGSQQPMHQDAAYVRVNTVMEFAAAWIAFEDIQIGSGELEYIEGSHRLPDHLFKNQSKWLPYGDSKANDEYFSSLIKSSEERKLKRSSFSARKGDVLIWSANLAHGGTKIVSKLASRQSLVIHYCPHGVHPTYMKTTKNSGLIPLAKTHYITYSYHGQPNPPM